MSQPPSTGTCNLCGGIFNRASMTRHLKTCRRPGLAPLAAGKRAASQPCFHLQIEDRYWKAYWLHVAIPADTTLAELDAFLRQIWVECCGHLSAFTIDGKSYASHAEKEYGELGMSARLKRILQVGMRFSYEYDFGSTTELILKVVAPRDELPDPDPVRLLARNDPPEIICDQCGDRPATQICTECAWSGKGRLCDACLEDHPCGKEMCLPVVNSPRVGVCGYTG